MKVVFAQRMWHEMLGPMSLSAVLRRAGHETVAVISGSVARLTHRVLAERPDLVALYWCSDDHHFLDLVCRELKAARPELRIIAGGPHPTLVPSMIEQVPLDAICRGEGEDALLEYVEALASGRGPGAIPNLWVRDGETITRTPMRALCAHLDELPDPDRDVYSGYTLLHDNPVRPFMSSRGCSGSCTFCSAPRQREMSRGLGPFVRWRSPERVIEEILRLKDRGLRYVRFEDESFCQSPRWLYPFLLAYKEAVGLPFLCFVRADQVSDEMARRLADANCDTVSFGVETGDEEIRTTLLGKRILDEQFIEAARTLRRHGLRLYTTNMLGFPGDTLDAGFATVHLNQRVAPDEVLCFVFQPYAGLALTEHAIREGLITRAEVEGATSRPYGHNALPLPEREALFNLQKLFGPAVLFPRLEPLLRVLVRLPGNPLFRLTFLGYQAWAYSRHARISPLRLVWEGAHLLGMYTGKRS
jgi:radical SAM superfamily enzyme YgiQ (UPF0313 family)